MSEWHPFLIEWAQRILLESNTWLESPGNEAIISIENLKNKIIGNFENEVGPGVLQLRIQHTSSYKISLTKRTEFRYSQ